MDWYIVYYEKNLTSQPHLNIMCGKKKERDCPKWQNMPLVKKIKCSRFLLINDFFVMFILLLLFLKDPKIKVCREEEKHIWKLTFLMIN